jgi:small GTP-binding protein
LNGIGSEVIDIPTILRLGKFLLAMECPLERRVCIKLILVGPSGVGKTSLISTYLSGEPEPHPVTTVTPAFSNAVITLDTGIVVDLQIWDTAGQEKYASVSQIFYRDSHVAFVCYEPRNPRTIEPWMERIRQHVPNCTVILVATKADLLSDEERTSRFSRSLDVIQMHGAKGHYITSAVTGLSVPEVFYGAAEVGARYDLSLNPGLGVAESQQEGSSCC